MSDESAEEKTNLNRREFLNLAWLASLGFLFVDLAGVTYLFTMPRFKEGEFGGLFTLGNPDELPEVGTSPVNYPKLKFWLVRTDDGIAALYKVCTHLGCLYGWNDQENKFICPCHGSQFEYDGTYISGPAPRSLDRFVVQAVDPNTEELITETNVEGAPLSIPDQQGVVIRIDTGSRITGERHG
ncbi:MAG: Rieske 2Fe-2S domain-containing protein [Anaerolineales bacterium]|jgi:cytochrome b6-f complex iron-sulfur subunit